MDLLLIAALLATTTFHGTVVDGDGRPVAGAKVTFWHWVKSEQEMHTVLTGADGGFDLDTPDKYFRLVVVVPDGRIGVANGGTDTAFRVVVAPPKTAAGRLLGPDGRPAAGVRVAVTSVHTSSMSAHQRCAVPGGDLGAPWSTITDADGHWELHCLPDGGRLECAASGPRFETTPIDIDSTEPLVTTLALGATITGRVRFDDGRPAPGVFVAAEPYLDAFVFSGGATSGPDGRYTIDGLASLPFNLILFAYGLDDWTAVAREKLAPVRGQVTADVDFTLIHGQVIEGVVRDADTGAPVPKVEIGCYGAHRPLSSHTNTGATTDDAGHFTLRVPPGKTKVYCMGSPPGYLSVPQVAIDFEVRADQPPAPLVLRIQRGGELRGVVVDAAGAPAVGATVRASHANGGYPGGFGGTTTDREGRFHLQQLPRTGTVVVVVESADQLSTARQEVHAEALPAGELRLVLQARAVRGVAGRVVDPDGRPLPQTDVELVFDHPRVNKGPWDPRPSLKTKTDANGGYTFDDVPKEWVVRVKASRDGYGLVRGGAVDDAGGNLTCAPIVLEALSAQVRVTVVDAAGAPVAGAAAYVPPFLPSSRPVAGKDGVVAITRLPARALTVMAMAGRRAFGRGRWDGRAATLTVTVAEPPLAAATGPSEAELDQAEALLREAWQFSPSPDTAAQLAELDPSAALELADKLPRGRLRSDTFGAVLWTLANHRPLDALPFVKLAAALPSDGVRAAILARLGRRLLPGHRDDAGRLYAEALAAVGHAAGDERMMARMEVALLAEVLPAADAEAQAKALMDLVKGYAADPRGNMMEEMAEFLAEQPELVDRVLARTDAASRDRAHTRVIGVTARRDPRAALVLLRRWFPGNGPLQAAWPGHDGDDLYTEAPEGVVRLVAALAPVDADAALAVTRRMPEKQARALSLARIAAALPPDRAQSIAAEAVQAARVCQPQVLAAVARTVIEVAPDLAAKAFDEVLAAGENDNGPNDPQRTAMLLADYDPNTGRWRLERRLCVSQDQSLGNINWARAEVAEAFVALDLPRALELARANPDAAMSARILCRAGRWLSQSPAQRRAAVTDLDDHPSAFGDDD